MMEITVRFWGKVDIGDESECWLWTGASDPTGYGRFKIAGKSEMAHRVAYDLAIGGLESDLMVCHHCDNPPCCNPAHLFQGTRSDNMKDCGRKNRLNTQNRPDGWEPSRGEMANRSRLKAGDVLKIRTWASIGMSKRYIARSVGVAPSTISKITLRQKWTHI